MVDDSHIQVNVPLIIDPEENPKMYEDTDSVSTFHHNENVTLASVAPSKSFTPNILSSPPSVLASSASESRPVDINYQDDGESVSKLSDTQSRISSIEQDIKHLHSSFQHALAEMKRQSQHQASQQSLHEATLSEILSLLRTSKVSNSTEVTFDSSARDNPPGQSQPSGGSEGAAGEG
jgi:TolA-binding protein